MKALLHALPLALAACGGADHLGPAAGAAAPPAVEVQTLQKAGDACPPGGTAPDGSVPLACLDVKAGGS